MRLSPNFTEREMTCKCGCGVWRAHPLLIWALEELRAILGDKPIIPISGYRCPAHNRTLKDSNPNSLHMSGRAADIVVEGMTGDEILAAAQQVRWFVGFGVRPTSLHVDIGPGTRRIWRYFS